MRPIVTVGHFFVSHTKAAAICRHLVSVCLTWAAPAVSATQKLLLVDSNTSLYQNIKNRSGLDLRFIVIQNVALSVILHAHVMFVGVKRRITLLDTLSDITSPQSVTLGSANQQAILIFIQR